jgi:arylsulfatase A-like enzyme
MTSAQIVQNVDLCPTFSELALTPPPATVNGHSLVALLRGELVADWRNVALVEHHDPLFDPNDPDADTSGSVMKGPPTYDALRTADSVYVEYVGTETEYHAHASDPFELHNTAAQLSPDQVAKFHAAISAVKNCKTSAECWAAQHLQP